jgi:Flp pilus assembly protein TadG
MNRLIAKFRQAWRQFTAANAGNTVVTFALAFLPLMGLTGAAVDYTHANQLRTAMQAAADATVLMIAQNAASQTASAVQSSTSNYYNALFTNPAVTNLRVTGTYDNTDGSTVVVSATATYKTSFMNIMGFPTLTLAATSTASFGNKRLRVALVLDNTGSMGSAGKLDALKTATKDLLDQLKAAAINNGDVYVSIVPFVKDVNVGSGNYNASWVYWDDSAHSDNKSWDALNGSCSVSGYNNRSSCTSHSSCSISGYYSQSTCTSARTWSGSGWTSGVWSTGAWTPDNHNTWNGCVMDRGNSGGPSSSNYDTNVLAPTTSDTASLYAAEQYGSCPQAVMGLNYNWSDMKSLVDDMVAAGNTNQAIGLQLGWMSLTGGRPFTMPAEDANYTYQHVIILLTDGLNTQDRWYTSQSSIDARQALTCANVKAAGVTLYTIQVNTDSQPTSTLLQTCATDSSKFFLLTSASQILPTFRQIGANLAKLHIAK